MTYTTDENQRATIQWDEKGQPISEKFQDYYFSKVSGIDETRYVFLEGNNIEARAANLDNTQGFTIAETGFGTGLNFLTTWQLWRQKNLAPRLHFISVEKYALSSADLARALKLWPELHHLSEALLASYPPQPCSGCHRLIFDDGKIQLTLFFGEAHEAYEQLCSTKKSLLGKGILDYGFGPHPPKVDAWYLDGFTPAKNPAMWSPELFDAISRLSRKNASVATFTAASSVRKLLTHCGFSCERIKGYGLKREMLTASFRGIPERHDGEENKQSVHSEQSRKARPQLYWHLISNESHPSPTKTCIIIGAGMAGCHTARALAERGIDVIILEKHAEIAQGASGNDQGIVYAKLSPFQDPLSQFNLSSLIFATNFYHAGNYYQDCGDACGVLFLARTQKQVSLYRQFAERFAGENFVRYLSPQSCKTVSGIASEFEALFLPQSGWLKPRLLCEHLLDHPKISIQYGAHVDRLERQDGHWLARDNNDVILGRADTAVICSANETTSLSQSGYLPLKKIRGQVTNLRSSGVLQELKSVICGEGYIAPARDGVHTVGASYNLDDDSTVLNPLDHDANIEKVRALSPDLGTLVMPSNLDAGRVGFRCTTPDYFPLVGPQPNHHQLLGRFAILRKKAKSKIDVAGAYHPQLYTHVGLGSRGLCYSPLCAEIIASLISGDFLPISEDLYRFLHPARFLIRDLIRHKI